MGRCQCFFLIILPSTMVDASCVSFCLLSLLPFLKRMGGEVLLFMEAEQVLFGCCGGAVAVAVELWLQLWLLWRCRCGCCSGAVAAVVWLLRWCHFPPGHPSPLAVEGLSVTAFYQSICQHL
jgi:hypothetical protein